jgi:hypothetical protein
MSLHIWGCVLAEINAVLAGLTVDELEEIKALGPIGHLATPQPAPKNAGPALWNDRLTAPGGIGCRKPRRRGPASRSGFAARPNGLDGRMLLRCGVDVTTTWTAARFGARRVSTHCKVHTHTTRPSRAAFLPNEQPRICLPHVGSCIWFRRVSDTRGYRRPRAK